MIRSSLVISATTIIHETASVITDHVLHGEERTRTLVCINPCSALLRLPSAILANFPIASMNQNIEHVCTCTFRSLLLQFFNRGKHLLLYVIYKHILAADMFVRNTLTLLHLDMILHMKMQLIAIVFEHLC